MPEHSEKSVNNNEVVTEQLAEQLEQLFDVAVGKETSLDDLRRTLYAGEPQGVFRALVTRDFRIFLSNRTHESIAKANGVEWEDVLLAPFIPAGDLLAGDWRLGYWYWDDTDDKKLADFFREKTRLQEKYSQQMLQDTFERALRSRISKFTEKNLLKK